MGDDMSRVSDRVGKKSVIRQACQQIPQSKIVRMAHNQVSSKRRKPRTVMAAFYHGVQEVGLDLPVVTVPEGKQQCPRCSKIVAVKKDGTLYKHACS